MLGLYLGYTKFYCFLRQWDSRERKHHSLTNSGLNKNRFFHERKSGKYSKNQHWKSLTYITNFSCTKKVNTISDAKIKEWVFIGSQTRQLINDIKSEDKLSEVDKAVCNSFKNVTTILGEITRQKTTVIWRLILYIPTKLWG